MSATKAAIAAGVVAIGATCYTLITLARSSSPSIPLPPSVTLAVLHHCPRAFLIDLLTSHLSDGQWQDLSDQQLRAICRKLLVALVEHQTASPLGAIISAAAVPEASSQPARALPRVASAPTGQLQSGRPASRLRRSASMGLTDDCTPVVVLSYQSTQLQFMKKLVGALEANGIRTVDGTRWGDCWCLIVMSGVVYVFNESFCTMSVFNAFFKCSEFLEHKVWVDALLVQGACWYGLEEVNDHLLEACN